MTRVLTVVRRRAGGAAPFGRPVTVWVVGDVESVPRSAPAGNVSIVIGARPCGGAVSAIRQAPGPWNASCCSSGHVKQEGSVQPKANILIVDADADSVRNQTGILTRGGHRLVAVDGCAMALERLRAQGFDLAIVAMDLPDATGIDVLARIKESSPEIPVVLTAARPEVETTILALRRGAYDFLKQPIAEDELLALAERAAQLKQMGSERRRALEELQTEKVKNFELRRNLQGQYTFSCVNSAANYVYSFGAINSRWRQA